jgi:hypothetical protein
MTCNKIAYSTKADALADARLMRARNRHFSKQSDSHKTGKKHRAYECPLCGLWHLTTRDQKYFARKKRKL